jgi:ribonuclease R
LKASAALWLSASRILARTEERGNGWVAHVMKKLAKGSEQILGVVESGDNGRFWLKSVDKKARFDTPNRRSR